MDRQNGEVHVDETEASGGSKEGVVRWVLGIGLILAIAFMSIIWITGALSQGDAESEITATGNINAADSGDGTDSIVSDDAATIEDTGTGDVDTIANDVEISPDATETVEPE